jgi:integrase/recombinase XerD
MRVYLEPEEVIMLENEATNFRDRLLIHVLFHLGCRVSEALAIKVDDIDFKQGTVTIIHLKRRLKLSCTACEAQLGAAHLYCPKCGCKIEKSHADQQQYRRQRILPIDSQTLSILQEFIQHGGPILRNDKKFIFGINRHRAWQIVRECAEKVGLPKLINPETGKVHNVSPHKLRDAFAVHAVKLNDSGDGLRLLQEHLGHQSFNTTAKYRKISGKEHEEWYRRLWIKDES